MKISTKVIHAGQTHDFETGAIMPPIYMTSTFAQEAPGETKGYDYTRAGNPNFTALEKMLAELENARFATVYSAGLGALTALISTMQSGDSVVVLQGIYGGTWRLFNSVFKQFGINFIQTSPQDLEKALKKKPKYLLFETPTNPLLDVYDIHAFTNLAHAHGAKVVVDNTFATPINQNPLDFSADVVWHSTTKYISGHSDVVGGVLITNSPELKESFDFARKAMGLNPSPFDTWLTLRGIKTLAVRMKAHNENGKRIAGYLSTHPLVKKVFYPGYSMDAEKQMYGFSGIVSAEFDLSLNETKELISTFSLFTLAESLGGVESLVCHPASMTHASIPAEVRKETGLTDGLVRFSVGIEDPYDLIHDLDTALSVYIAAQT